MAPASEPMSPRSRRTSSLRELSTTAHLEGALLPLNPTFPAGTEPNLTALPRPDAAGYASSQSGRKILGPCHTLQADSQIVSSNSVTSSKARRPPAASHRHTSEKTYQIIRTFVSPSTHELVDNSPLPLPPTVRNYDRGVQRWRLWNLVWLEWVITLVLCIALWALLYGYSRHHIEVSGGLSVDQKRIFNALATGLSIALGLNLAGSLRSYIKILRWRLLATRYRPLSEFELILGLERHASLFKLLWKSRNKHHRFLPSLTQLLCILWITINLAAAILVSMLGLTYNIDQSMNFDSIRNGPVSVIDFKLLIRGGFIDSLSFVQNLAGVGANFESVSGSLSYNDAKGGKYETLGDTSRYWFDDFNAHDSNIQVRSGRYVDATVACNVYSVVEGIYGNQSSIIYQNGDLNVTHYLPAAGQPGPGGLVFIPDTAKTCGDRCTTTKILQAHGSAGQLENGLSGVDDAQFFVCNTTVSQVLNIPTESYDSYLMGDQVARMFAGAIGWSGQQVPNDTEQYLVYSATNGLTFKIFSSSSATEMAALLSRICIGAVAAMDNDDTDHDLRQIIQGQEPGYANFLQVVWWHAGPLLVLIPCLQLASLIVVIAIANRAVIKDDSYLGVAELYRSITGRLGNHGTMLRGDEIIDSLRNPATGEEPHVIYAWKDEDNGDFGHIKHIDVFDDTSGFEPQPAFVPGRYD